MSITSKHLNKIRLRQKDCLQQCMSMNDIESYTAILMDLGEAMLSYGFILEPDRYYNGYGLVKSPRPLSNTIVLSNKVGFVVSMFESQDVRDEMQHIAENIGILHPEYNVRISNYNTSHLTMVVSKPYINTLGL